MIQVGRVFRANRKLFAWFGGTRPIKFTILIIMKINTLLFAIFALLFLAIMLPARAQFAGWQANDVVLVLWANNYDTINYDLGNVSQFEGKTSGYVEQVTDWDESAATNYFGPWPAQGGFVPLNFNLGTASTATHVPYVTDNVAPNISSTLALNTVVNGLVNYSSGILAAGSTNYSVYQPNNKDAYDYNTSFETDWGIASLSGSGKVYTSLPGRITFWALGINSSTNIGAFQYTSDGRLFFEVPPILDRAKIILAQYDGVSEVDLAFATKVGANYQLLESTNLALPLSSWTTNVSAVVDYPAGGTSTGSLLGDGYAHTLSDLNATNRDEFYAIESF